MTPVRTSLRSAAVVYEAATGKSAFEGKSKASLIAKIMEAEPPPMSSSQALTPSALDRVVQSCLAKDPDDRWQNAAGLTRELKWIAEAGEQPATSISPGREVVGFRNRTLMYIGLAAAVLLLALGATLVLTRGTSVAPSASVIRTSILLPAGQRLTSEAADYPIAVSPDGSRIAYVAEEEAGTQLYVRE